MDSKVPDTLRKMVVSDEIYLLYTDATMEVEKVPFRVFELSYDKINVAEQGVPYEPHPQMEELKDVVPPDSAFLEQTLSFGPALYNDAELALSVLMGLKERMPQ